MNKLALWSGTAFAAVLIASAPVAAAGAPCTPVAQVQPNLDPATQAKIKALMAEMVDRKIAPGAVMMIEHRGQTVFTHVRGYADVERQEPMTADSLFRIYSMTKPLTSLAALQLVERRKLRLDDPVAKYIPEMAQLTVWTGAEDAATTEPLARPLTVRDLLTHSAGFGYQGDAAHPVLRQYAIKGIGAGPGVGGVPTDGSAPVRSLAEWAQRLATIPLLHQPGAKFSYGNASDVLGRVIEVAAGQPYAEQMRTAVLAPMGMTSTSFRVAPGRAALLTSVYMAKSSAKPDAGVFEAPAIADLPEGRLTRIDDGKASIFTRTDTLDYGGAGLVSTAGDYLRFTRALREGGAIDGQRVLSATLTKAMLSDQLTDSARSEAKLLHGAGFGYGLGVRLAPNSEGAAYPQCSAFWGGAGSTYFWVDRAGETSGVLMTQVFGGDVKSFWLAIMQALYTRTK